MKTMQTASTQSTSKPVSHKADSLVAVHHARVKRMAAVGGGSITPPAVFAHIRKTMAAKTKRPA